MICFAWFEQLWYGIRSEVNGFRTRPTLHGSALMAVGLRRCHWLLAVSHHCPGSYPIWACEKVASDMGLGSAFCRILRFPPPVSHDLAEIWQKK